MCFCLGCTMVQQCTPLEMGYNGSSICSNNTKADLAGSLKECVVRYIQIHPKIFLKAFYDTEDDPFLSVFSMTQQTIQEALLYSLVNGPTCHHRCLVLMGSLPVNEHGNILFTYICIIINETGRGNLENYQRVGLLIIIFIF